MTFQPGQSGNPSGRPKARPFRDALHLAVKRAVKDAEDDKVHLAGVAEALVDKAMTGDVAAIREIADRLDGKVPQAQIHMGDEDGAPVRFEKIERVIVDSPNSDSPRVPAVP